MRCLTLLVLIVLIALLGLSSYNYLQIERLSHDVEAIKVQAEPIDESSAESKDLLGSLSLATQHTLRAKDLIAKGQFNLARQELDKSLQKLGNASRLSKDLTGGALDRAGTTLQNVKKQAEAMLEEVSKHSGGRRFEGHESTNGE